jgi:phenylacetate-CoA ligase
MTNKDTLLPHWKYPADYYQRSTFSLNTALEKVALYTNWRQLDPGKDVNIDLRFTAMPALTKKDIRENFPKSILPSDKNMEQGIANGEIELVETSGTTNDKITNIWNQKWWDASERASWKLNANTAGFPDVPPKEAILVNPLNVGFKSDTADLPFEKRRLGRFLYLNEKTDPLAWPTAIMDRMISELNTFQPDILESNPSMLARLCRYIAAAGKKVHQPKLITFTYEYPTKFHYQQIGRVFQCPTASSYGSTETGYVFMQCEHGNFHQNTDFCRVDFQPLKKEQGGPYLGRILVTPLGNPWSYLMRFDTGDLVHVKEDGTCPCGRNSGIILSAICGRTVNLTKTTNGRLVTLLELDREISHLNGIEMYKLTQTGDKDYEIRAVTRRDIRSQLHEGLMEILHNQYGKEAAISVIFDKDIAPEISGKYLVSRSVFDIDLENYIDRDLIPRK